MMRIVVLEGYSDRGGMYTVGVFQGQNQLDQKYLNSLEAAEDAVSYIKSQGYAQIKTKDVTFGGDY